MGDDAINLFTGAVVAEPGAADQPLHMDGGHLWQGTARLSSRSARRTAATSSSRSST